MWVNCPRGLPCVAYKTLKFIFCRLGQVGLPRHLSVCSNVARRSMQQKIF